MRRALLCLGLLLLVSGCAGTARTAVLASPSASPTAEPTASPTPSPAPRPTPSPTARPTRAAPSHPAIRTAAPARRTAAAKPLPRRTVATAAPPTCPRVPAVGSATQVVLVVGSGSSATVRACQRRAGQWVSVLGTMYGHVGVHGVAPSGAKREGDGRTPSGVYSLGRGFGVQADPGVAFRWTRVTTADVWVDDPGSSLYNTWQRTPANGRWVSAESLYQPGPYAYAQVIDYNTARTPGRGSAIFLHVDHGSGTAGCVSVPRSLLLALLRWERGGAVIAIR